MSLRQFNLTNAMKTRHIIKTIFLIIGTASIISINKSQTFANNKQINSQILVAQQNSEIEAAIEELTQRWIDGWSPGEQAFDTSKLQPLYAQGNNAILVYDDIGEEVAVIRSWDEYAGRWQPFMQQFAYWSIAPEGEIEVTATENMAVSNFVWVGEARYKDGREITPKQYATLVWQKQDGNWVIVREHLTAAKN